MSETRLSTRTSRSSESRSHESRAAESDRTTLSFDVSSRFNVPAAVLASDPDHSYAYITYSSGGQDLMSEYEDAVNRRGYLPVARSSNPAFNRAMVASPFKRQEDDDLVKIAGHILMKRPVEITHKENEFYSDINARQKYISSLHNNPNPGAPKVMEDQRRWSPT